MVKHISCDRKCKFNSTTCNSNKKLNNKTCQCEYKIFCACKNDYSWNLTTCASDRYLEALLILQYLYEMRLYVMDIVSTNVTSIVLIKSDKKCRISNVLLYFSYGFISDHIATYKYY